jgi:signal transduction histidine kinase
MTQAAHRNGRPGPVPDAPGADVLSKLGHELRSPLTGIIGLTTILLIRLGAGTADAVTQVRQLEMIQASAVRSLATIDVVVDLAMIDSGRVRPRPQLVDCREIVADVATKMRTDAPDRAPRLLTDVPGRPVMVTSDPEILGQVLSELVGNGLRFTDAGEVRLRLHASDKPVIIDVADDGPGIPAHEQALLFEPFERGQVAAERDDGAPGLGLHRARKQAELLGAELSVASQTGLGSTFTVTFAEPGARPGAGPGADPRS